MNMDNLLYLPRQEPPHTVVEICRLNVNALKLPTSVIGVSRTRSAPYFCTSPLVICIVLKGLQSLSVYCLACKEVWWLTGSKASAKLPTIDSEVHEGMILEKFV